MKVTVEFIDTPCLNPNEGEWDILPYSSMTITETMCNLIPNLYFLYTSHVEINKYEFYCINYTVNPLIV